MYKLFSIFSISSLLQGHAVNRSILAFMSVITRTFKAVNRRALSTIGTTLMLSALLSACGGGGGSGSDAPAPTSTAPIFSVLSSNFSVDEDFATPQIVALVANATAITVSQSNTGVVTVTTSNSRFIVSSIANANGRTILTIRATNGTLIATTQVTVTVNAVNDPPTLAVSSNSISTVGSFSPITINTTASDIEDGALAFTVSESTPGVVRVTTSANAITLNAISNASGQTTLTITAVDSSGSTVTQTIAVDVTITTSTSIPALSVSSNIINVQEDFTTSVIIRTTATDADGDTITLSVSPLRGIVNADISTSVISTNTIVNTITLSAVANAHGTATLTVRATDAGGQSTEVNIVVVVASVVTVLPTPLFIVTTGIKTLDFAWSAISTATHYQLQSNPDGNSGFTDLSTTGIVVSPNSTNIRQTTAQALVALHRYIPNVRNPQYSVGTCNTASSCGPSFRHNTVSLTNAQLNSLIGRLQASNAQIHDRFGASVSLSGDGNTLAVGAWGEDGSSTGVNGAQDDNAASNSGAVYVFRRIGGAWSQQAYIKASNTGRDDSFGRNVSLNGDGNTLAVGARFENSSSTGVNGAQDDNNSSATGAVYVFRFNTTSRTWSQQAYIKASNTGVLDEFGNSVSLSADGNTLAVGAAFEDSSSTGVNGAQNDNTAANSGAVYLFRFNTTSSIWSQQAYIKASNTGADDRFGFSVSLSADGNTLAVGATYEDGSSTGVNGTQNNNTASNSGAVYVFRFSAGSSIWSQQAYIKASNTGASDFFGTSVSLSSDGNTLAVAAPFEDSSSTGVNGAQDDNTFSASGAVYVFRFNTTSRTWSQQVYIKASNTGLDDFFGISVSLSSDGITLAVGATGEDGSATGIGGVDDNDIGHTGATYVFEFANGAWAQQAYIKATDTSFNALFGSSVNLSSNGNTLVVGADGVTILEGAVYLY